MFFLAYHNQKIALLRKEKKLFHIEHLRILNANVKPLDILNSILKKKKRFKLVTGLETEDVLSRALSLKLKSKKEILAALPFQVESLLPYSKEELILLPTLHQHKEQTEVFLLATSKLAIKEHLTTLTPYELDPDTISCVPLALFRFARHFFPKYSSLFIHHKEKQRHAFVVIHEERLKAFQFHKAQDFERMCAYMQKKYPDIQHILNFGGEVAPAPFTSLDVTNPNLAEYAIPIGLALDAAKNDMHSGQFRQFQPSKKNLRKRKGQYIGYAIACSSFIATAIGMGNWHLRTQESAILNALGCSNEIRLSKVVEQLESSLYQEKKSALHLPTIPKVYEVLSWLSAHPKLSKDCSITRLNYQITKLPKLGSKIKTYAAKVELELIMPNSPTARAFHESLLKDRLMVDQKEGVKWSADHGVYLTSFYLKPRQSQ